MTDEGWVGLEPTDDDLADVLAAAAEGLAGVVRSESDDEITWAFGSTPFAVLSAGGRAEFRLDPLVARAALRTPDTSASERGAEWVAFAPDSLDEGAVDRAEAWFLSAHRRASAPGR